MNDDRISVSDLKAHAQVLIEMKLMPPLRELLAAVAETRKKYKPKINAARRERKKR